MATVSEYAGRLPSPLLRISIDHLDKHDVIILIFLIVDDDWFDVLVVGTASFMDTMAQNTGNCLFFLRT